MNRSEVEVRRFFLYQESSIKMKDKTKHNNMLAKHKLKKKNNNFKVYFMMLFSYYYIAIKCKSIIKIKIIKIT